MHKNEKVQAAFELAERLNHAGLYAQGYYIIGLRRKRRNPWRPT
jgi:hypothetical protein